MSVNIENILKYIPSSRKNLERYQYIRKNNGSMRIAVFGNFNHGKSSLLNAIIGEEIFTVADKRETIINKEYKHNNAIWIDTPGLNADIKGEDDKKAKDAAFKIADFLFIVHNVQTGELDKYETNLYQDLLKQDKNYRRKMILILTQIDQCDESQVTHVSKKIKEQLPELTIIPVSATRYSKGLKENKQLLIQKSNMAVLFEKIGQLNFDLQKLRKDELTHLKNKAIYEFDSYLQDLNLKLNQKQFEVTKLNDEITKEVKQIFNT